MNVKNVLAGVFFFLIELQSILQTRIAEKII